MNFDVPAFLELCRSKSITLVTAESCTGGLISGALTEVAGSSDVVWGAFVVYANEAKSASLSVPPSLIEEEGAVSEAVVVAMAEGALRKSGVAGPGGGSPEKPVGTVWIAAVTEDGKKETLRFLFPGNRAAVREATVEKSLELCEKLILK